MLVIHSLSDCGIVIIFLSGLIRVSQIKTQLLNLRSLENFVLKVQGSGIFRNGGLPEMEGVVFEMKVQGGF